MVTAVPEPTPELADRVLALTTRQGSTVRTYLTELLAGLWLGEASAKYGMTGESDWQYDLYVPMRDAGLIPAWRDGWGLDRQDHRGADRLICAAIERAMEAS